MNLFNFGYQIIQEIGLSDVLDVLFISVFIYLFLVLFKQSKARLIIIGIVILSFVYIIAQQLNLVLTSTFLQTFFAVIIIAILIIFQDEIRRFFEQIAVWSLSPKWRQNKTAGVYETETKILCDVLSDLASQRVGALIVLPGKINVSDILEGGETLDGKLSEGLLKSIFDPHSAGHDGAVVIQEATVKTFGTHLPLSNNFSQLKNRGTRHAAALGLAEVSDSLCLVVSEERGAVSVAWKGILRQVSIDELRAAIQEFYNQFNPPAEKITRFSITSNFKEKIISVFLAILLWFVFVYESRQVYREFEIPVTHTSLPSKLSINEIQPQKVTVTLLASKRQFYFFSNSELNILLKIPDPKPGKYVVEIARSDITFPEGVSFESVEPEEVTVIIEKISPSN